MTTANAPLILFAYYYGGGLLWLCLCFALGAMQARGEPIQTVTWIVLNAALWPALLAKLARDLARGEDWTDFT